MSELFQSKSSDTCKLWMTLKESSDIWLLPQSLTLGIFKQIPNFENQSGINESQRSVCFLTFIGHGYMGWCYYLVITNRGCDGKILHFSVSKAQGQLGREFKSTKNVDNVYCRKGYMHGRTRSLDTVINKWTRTINSFEKGQFFMDIFNKRRMWGKLGGRNS